MPRCMALAAMPCLAFQAATDRTPIRRIWSVAVGKTVSVPMPIFGGTNHDCRVRADDHPVMPTGQEHRHDPCKAA